MRLTDGRGAAILIIHFLAKALLTAFAPVRRHVDVASLN
jgi:hypothetical protein